MWPIYVRSFKLSIDPYKLYLVSKYKTLKDLKRNLTAFNLYLITVDAVVDRPSCLKILQHSLLEALWKMMDAYEVLEVFGSGVILGPA